MLDKHTRSYRNRWQLSSRIKGAHCGVGGRSRPFQHKTSFILAGVMRAESPSFPSSFVLRRQPQTLIMTLCREGRGVVGAGGLFHFQLTPFAVKSYSVKS